MSSNWTALVTSALSVLGAGGGMGAAVAAIVRWRKTRADAADVITDTALILVEPLKERIKELESEIGRLRSEARQTANELRRIRTAILDPAVTLEELRALTNPSGHKWTVL
jgi:uncharacterized small protein (DUF1192 family)